MFDYLKTLIALTNDRRGVTAMEYGIIAALIAVAIITAVTATGTKLSGLFSSLTASI